MKKLVAIVLCSLMATSAFALVDPDPDMLGIYWDTEGDVVCQPGIFGQMYGYILYTTPSIEFTRGFECGLSQKYADGTDLTPVWFPPSFPVPGINPAEMPYIAVGYATPLATSTATLMATISWYNLEPVNEVDFFLGPCVPSSNDEGLPMVMLDDYSLMTVGPSSNETHCAQINGLECRVIPNEGASFGNVKALFR